MVLVKLTDVFRQLFDFDEAKCNQNSLNCPNKEGQSFPRERIKSKVGPHVYWA